MPLDEFKKEYGSNKPPPVDPKFKKEFIGSIGGQPHTHKTHEEWYDSENRTTHVEDKEDDPKTQTEKIHFKNGRVVGYEVDQKQYNEETKTVEEKHGVFEETPPQININRTIRNGRVIKKEIGGQFFDSELGANVNVHDIIEDVTGERQINVRAIDGFIYEREITEKTYNAEENVFETKHGTDQKRLDCGHLMQGVVHRCSLCGATFCDDDRCGAKVNNRIVCSGHIMAARDMRQLYR